MYDGKLRSHHEVTAPSCLRFVDVAIGEEVQKSTSWVVSLHWTFFLGGSSLMFPQNEEEVKVMVHLVQHYYAELDYCIITPYDSQRKAIERALLDAGLPVKCFNVDSFQGNMSAQIWVSWNSASLLYIQAMKPTTLSSLPFGPQRRMLASSAYTVDLEG